MFQAMTIVVVLFTQLLHCIDPAVLRIAFLLQEQLPVDIVPLQKSALLQILVAALYAKLQKMADKLQKKKGAVITCILQSDLLVVL